jgi:DNA-binding response OmpR family regulator
MNIKILAIVDEENANDIMSILTELKKYSIQPIITSNILDGIDLFIENNPPILILDDKLEGFMLAKTINDMQNNKTVIFMLTKLEKILLSKEHLNINFYIPKPLNRIFLQVTIMSYLKNYIFIEKENRESCEKTSRKFAK